VDQLCLCYSQVRPGGILRSSSSKPTALLLLRRLHLQLVRLIPRTGDAFSPVSQDRPAPPDAAEPRLAKLEYAQDEYSYRRVFGAHPLTVGAFTSAPVEKHLVSRTHQRAIPLPSYRLRVRPAIDTYSVEVHYYAVAISSPVLAASNDATDAWDTTGTPRVLTRPLMSAALERDAFRPPQLLWTSIWELAILPLTVT